MAVIIPKGFFPVEDTGLLVINTEGPRGASFEAMAQMQGRLSEILRESPTSPTSCRTSAPAAPASPSTRAAAFVELKEREERPPIQQVIQSLRRDASRIPGLRVFINPIQNLNFGSRITRTLYLYTLQGLRLDELYDWAQRLEKKLLELPQLQDVNTDLQIDAPVSRSTWTATGPPRSASRSTMFGRRCSPPSAAGRSRPSMARRMPTR